MSIEAMSLVLNHSAAKGTTKLVLLGIAWHTGEDRLAGCWPSQQTLANYANCTPRQVRRCLNELIDLGEINSLTYGSARYGSNASTNLYQMFIDCPENCDMTYSHRRIVSDDADTEGTSGGHIRQVMRTRKADDADTNDLQKNI